MLTPEEKEIMFSESTCPYCLASDDEPHTEVCPLYVPDDKPASLVFDDTVSVNGTYFIGYLTDRADWPWSFEVTIGKLLNLQRNLADGAEKVAVEFHGKFNGHVFTLYDYKGDCELHIGGHKNELNGTVSTLESTLKNLKPIPFSFDIPLEYADECDTIVYPLTSSC